MHDFWTKLLAQIVKREQIYFVYGNFSLITDVRQRVFCLQYVLSYIFADFYQCSWRMYSSIGGDKISAVNQSYARPGLICILFDTRVINSMVF